MTEQNNMTADERYCYDCIHNEVCRWHPHDGCDFKESAKHSHWDINPDGYYPQCSNCGYEPPRELIRRNGDALIFPRYCTECGADTKREVK